MGSLWACKNLYRNIFGCLNDLRLTTFERETTTDSYEALVDRLTSRNGVVARPVPPVSEKNIGPPATPWAHVFIVSRKFRCTRKWSTCPPHTVNPKPWHFTLSAELHSTKCDTLTKCWITGGCGKGYKWRRNVWKARVCVKTSENVLLVEFQEESAMRRRT